MKHHRLPFVPCPRVAVALAEALAIAEALALAKKACPCGLGY